MPKRPHRGGDCPAVGHELFNGGTTNLATSRLFDFLRSNFSIGQTRIREGADLHRKLHRKSTGRFST
jgi:hypothetical protein